VAQGIQEGTLEVCDDAHVPQHADNVRMCVCARLSVYVCW
jgi:hypothetical protein